jgi:hypothetical protein
MFPAKLITITAALIAGIVLGLVYGWVIDPVEYTDVPPGILREDYRVDYVLTVAEAYQQDFNPESAARRLAVLGSESPALISANALDYANQNGFTENEARALQNLLTAMQTYQPQGNPIP